jgi:hypothetical protein
LKLIDLHGRFGSYGGIRLQMKAARFHCMHCALLLLITLTSAGAGVVAFERYGFRSKALQPARPPSPLGVLFDSDLPDFKGSAADILKGAVNNAPSSRPCLGDKPKFTIVIGAQDAELAGHLAVARKELIRKALEAASIGDHQYSLEFVRGPQDQDGAVTVTYQQAPDIERPLIVITPRLPRQVKGGDTVPFQIDAGDTKTKWESGIRSLQLRNDTIPGLVEPNFQDSRGRAPCPREPETMIRSWPVQYRVPRNPPVLIEFKGFAEDFAGNNATDTAILTTGQFSGHFEWSHKTTAADGSTEEASGDYVFSFDTDREGVVTGRIVGWNDVRFEGSTCPIVRLSRGSLAGNLAGSYTGGTFSISIETLDRDEDYPKVQYCGVGAPAGPHRVVVGFALFQEAFLRLRPQPDGSLQSRKVAGASPGSCTLTLRPRK